MTPTPEQAFWADLWYALLPVLPDRPRAPRPDRRPVPAE
jgi:hypothetical protein